MSAGSYLTLSLRLPRCPGRELYRLGRAGSHTHASAPIGHAPWMAQSRRALSSLARVLGGGEPGARPGGGGHAPGQLQRPWREHAGSVLARSPPPAKGRLQCLFSKPSTSLSCLPLG